MKKPKSDAEWFSRYDRFFDLVRELAPSTAVVLEIGANDGVTRDPIGHVWQPGWRGVFVEPNPWAMGRLKANVPPGEHTYLQCAVGEPGMLELFTMTRETADAFRAVTKDDGSCLTSTDRDHIGRRLIRRLPALCDRQGWGALIERLEVPCVTVAQALCMARVPSADVVQIDVEGMDGVIVRQVAALPPSGLPSVVMYEHQHLAVEDRAAADAALVAAGYTVEALRNDTIGWRTE